MVVIRNLLAVLGVVALIFLAFGLFNFFAFKSHFEEFDSEAWNVYASMYRKLLVTGSIAEATVWKAKVKPGFTVDDVENVIHLVAKENNIEIMRELVLSEESAAVSGKSHRFIKTYMFCNSQTATQMIAYNNAYSVQLPCRLSLVQDKNGILWLYAMNMDLLIHGGKALPQPLRKEAEEIRRTLTEVMDLAVTGEF